MPRTRIDHLVIVSPTLDDGIASIRQSLGVQPQPGGEHPRMGTHNVLLRLGASLYLEVMAPNPDAPPPQRPRWFDIDRRAAGAPPLLGAWVARTDDIAATAAASAEALGEIEPMRRGALEWRITIPADGRLPLDGIAPVLIEWQAEPHPAAGLPDHGLSLQRLALFHAQPERVTRLLSSLGFEGPVSVSPLPGGCEAPFLEARIATPQGVRTLSGRAG